MQKFVSSTFISFILALPLLTLACTDETRARDVLDKQGFKDVTITGYEWAACADSDSTHTGFTATNPQGRRVSGVVCCGFLKSCTVRW